MNRIFGVVCVAMGLFLVGAGEVGAQETAKVAKPQTAQEVLDGALKQAKAGHKPVMLIFHASWCGWCKRLDAVMERPEFHKMFAENYVVVRMDALERGDKKETAENAGANKMLETFGGAKSGIPFCVFLDEKGKKLADTNRMPKEGNIGYPGSPEEIAAFDRLLKETAPKWSDEQRGRLMDYLKKNAPAP